VKTTTIWKFALKITDRQHIRMPRGAQLLDVQMQGDTPCLWVIADPNNEPVLREIDIYGTGHLVSEGPNQHIGTIQDGAFVWHVFDQGQRKDTTDE
jgi:hypothetical protein